MLPNKLLPKNDKRADRAGKALHAYHPHVNHIDDVECRLTDLLTDLRHYADKWGFDFKEALERATDHYNTETRDPNE